MLPAEWYSVSLCNWSSDRWVVLPKVTWLICGRTGMWGDLTPKWTIVCYNDSQPPSDSVQEINCEATPETTKPISNSMIFYILPLFFFVAFLWSCWLCQLYPSYLKDRHAGEDMPLCVETHLTKAQLCEHNGWRNCPSDCSTCSEKWPSFGWGMGNHFFSLLLKRPIRLGPAFLSCELQWQVQKAFSQLEFCSQIRSNWKSAYRMWTITKVLKMSFATLWTVAVEIFGVLMIFSVY